MKHSLDSKRPPKTVLRKENGDLQKEDIICYLDDLEQRGFFGQVLLKYEAGKIVYVNESCGWTRDELRNKLRKTV